jgi:hypothetical protein
MGLRERLQSVTQFFQKAATRGHRLRQEDERDEQQASSAAEQTRQRDARRPGGMTADGRNKGQAGTRVRGS